MTAPHPIPLPWGERGRVREKISEGPGMGLINLLFRNPGAFVLLVIPLLYSIILHELAHGWVADKMGDGTAKWLGRLSLDPRKHLDPIGTLMLFIFGFGEA